MHSNRRPHETIELTIDGRIVTKEFQIQLNCVQKEAERSEPKKRKEKKKGIFLLLAIAIRLFGLEKLLLSLPIQKRTFSPSVREY